MRGIDVRVGRTVAEVEQVEPVEDGPEVFEPDPDYADWTDGDVAAEYVKVQAEHRRRLAPAGPCRGACLRRCAPGRRRAHAAAAIPIALRYPGATAV